MIISDIYIEEAIRIRKEYLKSVEYVDKYQNELNSYKNELLFHKNELDKNKNITEFEFNKKLQEIDVCIKKVQQKLTPFLDAIKKLDDEQRKLYYAIKEKYISITDDEIKNNLINAIKNI